jgi:DNA-binding MltR family transcriptional regulator
LARNINSPLGLNAYHGVLTRFHAESDRAAAVLGAAYLDGFLEDALRSSFAQGKPTDELFAGQGPLMSLGNKTKVAFALGLLSSESLVRDVDLIRKIRNHFAHHIWDAAFDESPVR